MVDPPRGVPVAGGIDYNLPVDRKKHGMGFAGCGVAAIGQRVADALAFVLHDALPLAYATQGKHPFSMDSRGANDKSRGPCRNALFHSRSVKIPWLGAIR